MNDLSLPIPMRATSALRFTNRPPGPDDVRRIVSEPDPVIRNLQITQSYADLSHAMAALTGSGANWCSVATWASKQAGQSIRNEDLMRTFERLLRGSASAAASMQMMMTEAAPTGGAPAQSLAGAADILWSAINPAAVFRRTSDAVARGNRKVFAEIGFEFARYLAFVQEDAPPAAFLAGLSEGEPPDGQGYLRQAFTHYHQARRADAPEDKAQWLLLANLEIGFHEQTRLQPEIVEALNAPIMDSRVLRRRLLEELLPPSAPDWRTWLNSLGDQARPVLEARDRLTDEARRIGRLTITEQMMTLAMPDGRTLRLGQDITAAFPATLRQVQLPELIALLARVDPTPDNVAETGAVDWGDLPDRMHFIADLFRAYHLSPALFNAPFTAEQTAQIRMGHRPPGQL